MNEQQQQQQQHVSYRIEQKIHEHTAHYMLTSIVT